MSEKDKELSVNNAETLSENKLKSIVNQMSADDQAFFYGPNGVELELQHRLKNFIVDIGNIALKVQGHLSHSGARTDLNKVNLTFEDWYKFHNLSKSMIYRAMRIAKGYNRIMALNDPDKDLMLENYLSLPRKKQDLIAKGQVDPEKTKDILHADADFRYSPAWKNMINNLDVKDDQINQLQAETKKLKDENLMLNKRNADLERSRADTVADKEKEQSRARHLEMALEEAQNREPEYREVPPEDYDDIKAEIRELRLNKKDNEETINSLKNELNAKSESQADTEKLKSQISQLREQNQKLEEQINSKKSASDEKQAAFRRVSEKTTDFYNLVSKLDFLSLIPDISKLSPEELKQTDLEAVANWFDDHAELIRKRLLRQADSHRMLDGDFKEVTN